MSSEQETVIDVEEQEEESKTEETKAEETGKTDAETFQKVTSLGWGNVSHVLIGPKGISIVPKGLADKYPYPKRSAQEIKPGATPEETTLFETMEELFAMMEGAGDHSKALESKDTEIQELRNKIAEFEKGQSDKDKVTKEDEEKVEKQKTEMEKEKETAETKSEKESETKEDEDHSVDLNADLRLLHKKFKDRQ